MSAAALVAWPSSGRAWNEVLGAGRCTCRRGLGRRAQVQRRRHAQAPALQRVVARATGRLRRAGPQRGRGRGLAGRQHRRGHTTRPRHRRRCRARRRGTRCVGDVMPRAAQRSGAPRGRWPSPRRRARSARRAARRRRRSRRPRGAGCCGCGEPCPRIRRPAARNRRSDQSCAGRLRRGQPARRRSNRPAAAQALPPPPARRSGPTWSPAGRRANRASGGPLHPPSAAPASRQPARPMPARRRAPSAAARPPDGVGSPDRSARASRGDFHAGRDGRPVAPRHLRPPLRGRDASVGRQPGKVPSAPHRPRPATASARRRSRQRRRWRCPARFPRGAGEYPPRGRPCTARPGPTAWPVLIAGDGWRSAPQTIARDSGARRRAARSGRVAVGSARMPSRAGCRSRRRSIGSHRQRSIQAGGTARSTARRHRRAASRPAPAPTLRPDAARRRHRHGRCGPARPDMRRVPASPRAGLAGEAHRGPGIPPAVPQSVPAVRPASSAPHSGDAAGRR
jgi:hypothetical protein